ncbi:large ribosomal subunit protein uL22m [Prorops nasuta]|uniref:large ribosomal subunit protein uL22m n=1 Tax=Prorops nasuta TaxID=863751 RepID=UPI0034CE5C2C
MQAIRQYSRILLSGSQFGVLKQININNGKTVLEATPICNIHLSRTIEKYNKEVEDYHWMKYNDVMFPVQKPGEERRPAFVCLVKKNFKYSPKKLWYIASFIRGMTVDEAIKQLSFMPQKGAAFIKDAILEAQELAVQEHNVEFRSNLWVAESNALKGLVVHGIRRHAKGRPGRVSYRYVNYFIRLEEGKPPEHYYLPYPKTQEELLEDWMKQMRMRKIPNTL